ncbi:MAG TPA: hypothetical protein VFZ79_16375 [Acidimicrobiales bacterium]
MTAQAEDAPGGPRRRSQHERARSQAEQLPGPDDGADRGRAHVLDLAEVDHEIGVVDHDRPSHGLRQRGDVGVVLVASNPHHGAGGDALHQLVRASTGDDD